MQCVRNCDSPDPNKRVVFEQPVLQTYVFFSSIACDGANKSSYDGDGG